MSINQNDILRCWTKFWQYLTEGVLAPGSDTNNMDLPFLHLTKYGRDIIKGITPYSKDSFIQKIETVSNQFLDDISNSHNKKKVVGKKKLNSLGIDKSECRRFIRRWEKENLSKS